MLLIPSNVTFKRCFRKSSLEQMLLRLPRHCWRRWWWQLFGGKTCTYTHRSRYAERSPGHSCDRAFTSLGSVLLRYARSSTFGGNRGCSTCVRFVCCVRADPAAHLVAIWRRSDRARPRSIWQIERRTFIARLHCAVRWVYVEIYVGLLCAHVWWICGVCEWTSSVLESVISAEIASISLSRRVKPRNKANACTHTHNNHIDTACRAAPSVRARVPVWESGAVIARAARKPARIIGFESETPPAAARKHQHRAHTRTLNSRNTTRTGSYYWTADTNCAAHKSCVWSSCRLVEISSAQHVPRVSCIATWYIKYIYKTRGIRATEWEMHDDYFATA